MFGAIVAEHPQAACRCASAHRLKVAPPAWALAVVVWVALATAVTAAQPPPVSGRRDPRLASFDELMRSFLSRYKVPGAALAVAREGRLVYARGFGWADREGKQPVRPDALFRIASVSKPITAVAVLKLVDRGKLKLSDRVFDIVKGPPHLAAGAKVDPNLRKITVRQVLRHSGGWDHGRSGDPMFMSVRIAEALGVDPPAGAKDVIRYMMGRPLDFVPGTKHVYSNFGYCVLGRVIEAAGGLGYEQYVRREVLAPLGITRMRIGRTLPAGRADGEVRYYDGAGGKGWGVLAAVSGQRVARPYGTWYLEAMDAHGGWIASAVDLVRFACALDDPKRSGLLSGESVTAMFARPSGLGGYDEKGKARDAYYAMGWMVRPVGREGKANTWHAGGLPGTSSLLVRRHDGLHWAVLFNARRGPKGEHLSQEIDPLLHQAAAKVKSWPTGDRFGEYFRSR